MIIGTLQEEDEVVIESGPVEYEKDDDPSAPEHAHTEGDTEDEDDELQHVSAAQLMGHMYNEGRPRQVTAPHRLFISVDCLESYRS